MQTQVPRRLRAARSGALLSAASIALAACSLGDPTAGLDADAEAMIRERQRLTLGPDSVNDPGVQPDLDAQEMAGPRNQHLPGTLNPPADRLPATSAQPADAADAATAGVPLEVPGGEDAIALDLEHLLGYAIANAPEYRGEKESLFLSALSLIIERHLWGPRFFNTVSAAVEGTPEGGDHDQVASILNDFSVTRRLPYGGSVSVSALVDYVDFLRRASTTTTDDETQSATLQLGIDLPLLRGAGIAAREDLIQAERNLVYAVRDFERFRRAFLVDLSRTYFDLLRQQGRIVNLERQLEGLERLAERFNELAEKGFEPAFEAERAQQQVLFGRSNLLNARESYVSSLDALKLRIGLPVERPLVIESARLAVPEPVLDPRQAVLAALDLRLDLQTSADRVDDARRSVRVARNDTLPDLDLDASVSLNTDRSARRGGADFQLEDSSYDAGLRFDVPLDRRIEKTRVRVALINLERDARDFRVFQDRVALQVRRSIRAIEQARFNLALQQRNVQIAERRLIGVQLRERTLGPRDTIEAQEDLAQARNQRDTALAEVQTSILNFLLDTGQMRVAADGQWLAPARLVPPEKPMEEFDPPAADSELSSNSPPAPPVSPEG